MGIKLKEKRNSLRIGVSLPMRYQIRGTAEFNNVIIDNISAGGLGFLHNKYIAPKTVVMLEVNVLSRILTPIGMIMRSSHLAHSDRYRLGIKFTELGPKDKNYLSDYIDLQAGRL